MFYLLFWLSCARALSRALALFLAGLLLAEQACTLSLLCRSRFLRSLFNIHSYYSP